MNPPKTEARPAAFLDRDGTIVVERNFLGDPDVIELIPGAVEAIRMLNQWGFYVIGISNQSGVARNYYGHADVEAVNGRLIQLLAAEGARLDRVYYCPHHPAVQRSHGRPPCDCRKPSPGMITRARADFAIDLKRSLVVGDQIADISLAQAVGISGILVLTGFGTWQNHHMPQDVSPAHVADDLLAAVRWFGQHQGLESVTKL
jgi:D-glycero-D-manno-heptose 1,7-bisphosphate phosphatase